MITNVLLKLFCRMSGLFRKNNLIFFVIIIEKLIDIIRFSDVFFYWIDYLTERIQTIIVGKFTFKATTRSLIITGLSKNQCILKLLLSFFTGCHFILSPHLEYICTNRMVTYQVFTKIICLKPEEIF